MRGALAGLLLAVGHSALELPVVLLLALGLGDFLESDTVELILSLVGGVVLLSFGLGSLRSAVASDEVASGTGQVIGGAISAGALVSLTNPFWVAWWGSVGARLVADGLKVGALGVAAVYLAHISTDVGWLTFLSYLAGKGRRLLGGSFYRALLMVAGLGLWTLGGWFLARFALGLS